MKLQTLASLSLVLLAGCSGGPNLKPIDSALLVEASSSARATVADARAARDLAGDEYAYAQSNTKKAEGQVEVARASLKTVRSQLDETKLAVEVASDSGSASELKRAESNHIYALAEADYEREVLAVRKREFELAKLKERLALEEHRWTLADVELKKAEALQDVDLVAAQEIPLKDHRKQVTYHQGEVETARGRVRTAEARLVDAKTTLKEIKRKKDSLNPHSKS